MGTRFSAPLLKSKLEIAVKRMQGQCNKKNNNVKIARREIAKLLQEKKDESARIRVEAVLHEIHLIEAMEIISLMCQLLSARVALLASEKYVPDDLIEAAASIIFCAKRLQIPELIDIAKLFASKFGEEWVKLHVNNQAEKVNVRIIDKLGVKPPEFDIVINYLHEVAKQYGVAWEPNFVEPQDKNNHYAMGAIAPLNFNELKAEAANEVFRPGTLNLMVHEARKLYATRMFGSMDPYCLLSYTAGKNAPVQYRTRWQKNSGVLLVFHDEHFPFSIKEAGQKIKLEVWDKNALIDDFIGHIMLDVDMLIQNPQQTYYKLTRGYDDKTDAGEVSISTQFMPYHPSDDDDEKRPVSQQAQAAPDLQFPGAPNHLPAAPNHIPAGVQYPPGVPANLPPQYPPSGPTPTPSSPPHNMYFPSVPGSQHPPPPRYDDSAFNHSPKQQPPPVASNGPPDVDELEARFRALQS